MRNIRIILAAFLILGPMAAQADVITISGQGASDGNWNVTTIFGTFNANSATLMNQEWWGSFSLAGTFARALGFDLGTPNGPFGPYFAYRRHNNHSHVRAAHRGHVDLLLPRRNVRRTYAIATRVPEPGTLALLGIGLLGMGLSRRKKLV